MERTKIHVMRELEDAIGWYRMYHRMAKGKSEGYMDGPLSRVIHKMKSLEVEYLSMGGSKYDSDFKKFQEVTGE